MNYTTQKSIRETFWGHTHTNGKNTMNYTTQKSIRETFWALHPELELESRQRGSLSRGQNAQTCTCRESFCNFVDILVRNQDITEKLGSKVTL